jgi:hypothetical protein
MSGLVRLSDTHNTTHFLETLFKTQIGISVENVGTICSGAFKLSLNEAEYTLLTKRCQRGGIKKIDISLRCARNLLILH